MSKKKKKETYTSPLITLSKQLKNIKEKERKELSSLSAEEFVESRKPQQINSKATKERIKKSLIAAIKTPTIPEKHLLKKPKVKLIHKLNSVSTVMKGGANIKFVSKGKTGYVDVQQMIENEKKGFLGKYSL